MFYIDIIGLYAFLYPLICFIAASIIRYVHRHIVTVMILTLFLIALLEVLSYGFASLIAITTIGFNEFISDEAYADNDCEFTICYYVWLVFQEIY